MEGGDEYAGPEGIAAAPEPGDALRRAEEQLGCEVPEGHDDLRPDELDALLEGRMAGRNLGLLRVPVAGGPARHRGGDVEIGAGAAHLLENQPVEEPHGPPD